jgi:ATPase involved in DNA replication initiation
MTRARQLPIPLVHPSASGRDDFIVGSANAEALATLDGFPDWPTPVTLLLGPAGSGKSHLARIFAERAGATIVGAGDVDALDPLDLAARPLVVEDADGPGRDDVALFHLLNAVRERGGHLLLTARDDPPVWGIGLADLLSRLRAARPLRLGAPDDELLARLLVKLFADRQIEVDRTVVDYLLPRIERSFAAASALVEDLDQGSLALGRKLTRPLAARLLGESAQDY